MGNSFSRECCGKKKYREGQAYNVAKKMTKKNNELITPYKCAFCGGWHVGHATRQARISLANNWKAASV